MTHIKNPNLRANRVKNGDSTLMVPSIANFVSFIFQHQYGCDVAYIIFIGKQKKKHNGAFSCRLPPQQSKKFKNNINFHKIYITILTINLHRH